MSQLRTLGTNSESRIAILNALLESERSGLELIESLIRQNEVMECTTCASFVKESVVGMKCIDVLGFDTGICFSTAGAVCMVIVVSALLGFCLCLIRSHRLAISRIYSEHQTIVLNLQESIDTDKRKMEDLAALALELVSKSDH